VIEECKKECTTTGAAIFCNGQFLATAGDLKACADQIEAEFQVTLDVSVAVECKGNECTAEVDGEGGCAICSTAPPGTARPRWGFGLMAIAGLGLGAWRRRTRRGARS
jgi:MYXO-CTERM domain-containing protein